MWSHITELNQTEIVSTTTHHRETTTPTRGKRVMLTRIQPLVQFTPVDKQEKRAKLTHAARIRFHIRY